MRLRRLQIIAVRRIELVCERREGMLYKAMCRQGDELRCLRLKMGLSRHRHAAARLTQYMRQAKGSLCVLNRDS